MRATANIAVCTKSAWNQTAGKPWTWKYFVLPDLQADATVNLEALLHPPLAMEGKWRPARKRPKENGVYTPFRGWAMRGSNPRPSVCKFCLSRPRPSLLLPILPSECTNSACLYPG